MATNLVGTRLVVGELGPERIAAVIVEPVIADRGAALPAHYLRAVREACSDLGVLFALGRVSGWMAHWAELVRDEEQKIARPRQVYLGEQERAPGRQDRRRVREKTFDAAFRHVQPGAGVSRN